jgi:hypothetical protein
MGEQGQKYNGEAESCGEILCLLISPECSILIPKIDFVYFSEEIKDKLIEVNIFLPLGLALHYILCISYHTTYIKKKERQLNHYFLNRCMLIAYQGFKMN